MVGNYGNDRLYGGSGNDRLYGSTGDDKLYSGSGNDILVGGAGKDILIGAGGADRLYGDDGEDVFVLRAADIGTTSRYTRIRDFKDGEDKLDISQRGSEVVRKTAFGDHTVLWLGPTNTKVLALLENITPDQITSQDLVTLPEIA